MKYYYNANCITRSLEKANVQVTTIIDITTIINNTTSIIS